MGKKHKSKPLSGTFERVSGPPGGEPFIWVTAKLLASPAWRAQSLHCRRLIDRLMRENMAHAGRENGNLAVAYTQLVESGIGRRFIALAIREAEELGLLRVARGGKYHHVDDPLSRYRLTWLPEMRTEPDGRPYWVRGSNEWEHVTAERAQAVRGVLKHDARAASEARRRNHGNVSTPSADDLGARIKKYRGKN